MPISFASTQCRRGHQQQRLCALQVLVLNLRSEMGALLHNQVDDCSDVLLNLPDLNSSAVAHNEDMTTDAANHTYFVHAQQVGRLLHVCLALSRHNNLRHVQRSGGFRQEALCTSQTLLPGLPVGLYETLCSPAQVVNQKAAFQWMLNLSLCRAMSSGQPTPMQASCQPRHLASTRQASASP